MINFGYCEDDLTGKVKLFYTGDELNYDRIIVKETGQSFDHFSNPIIETFLSGISTLELDLKVSGVFPIELCFLAFKPERVVINQNELHREGILLDFLDVEQLYIEEFYKIDKSNSTNDMLFLDRPVEQLGPVYSVKTIQKCVTYLTPLKDKVVDKVLNGGKYDKEWIQDVLVKIKLINIQTSCEKRIQLYKSISM